MAAKKYSDSDIAHLANRDYASLDPYQKRLVSGYNRGLSRAQASGHARTKYGELPVSQRPNTPKLAKGTGRVAPTVPVSQRKKVSGPYVRNVFSRKEPEKMVGKRINARTLDTFKKQLDKLPDSSGVLIKVIDAKGNVEVKAVGKGKGNTVNVGELKASIEGRMASSDMTWEEAFNDALITDFDTYEDDSDEVDMLPASPTNYVAYAMY